MSQPGHINHDTAARLLGITPGDLEALVKSGAVRRADRNAYNLTVLVQDYIGHLKTERDRRELSPKQAEIAEHLDMSDRSVREFLDESGVDQKLSTLSEIRVAYIRRQREVAAGRATSGGIDLATERAALARAQREKIEMANAVTRGELAPVILIEEVLTKTASKVAGVLDTIPGMVRRRVPQLNADEIAMIGMEIAKARNAVASMSLSDLSDDPIAADDDDPIIDEAS
jgi:terminase small subunit / prophage DNA-packing protein